MGKEKRNRSDGGGKGDESSKKQKLNSGKPSPKTQQQPQQPRSLLESLKKGGKKINIKKAGSPKDDGKNKSEGGSKDKKPFQKKEGKSTGNGGKGGKSSKPAPPLTPAERRALKPNFTLVEGLKSMWNTVRIRATPADVRSKLVQQMATKMEGHIMQVTLRHDASRIVESILQYGNEKQREKILTEVANKLFEIAKTPYGHFVVLKAITYCTGNAEQKKIASAFVDHFVSLGAHVIGARTVESILQLYPTSLTRHLKAEFYGKKFVLLAPECPKHLRHLVEMIPAKVIPSPNTILSNDPQFSSKRTLL